jgi:hypothetical protein
MAAIKTPAGNGKPPGSDPEPYLERRMLRLHYLYVENGDFSGTLDVSTFSSCLRAFFAAFFAFLAVFRSSFVFLDIERRPPFIASCG